MPLRASRPSVAGSGTVSKIRTESDPEALHKTAEELHDRGIRGIILHRPFGPVDELPFCWQDFASVRISGNPQVGNIPNVMLNNTQGMTLVLRELKARGYRRPGLVHMPHVSATSGYQWPCAYALAPLLMPEAEPVPLAFPRGIPLPEGVGLLREWITARQLDCVLFAEEAWFQAWVQRAGWRIPQEIGFCSLHADSSSVAGLLRGTSFGREAVDLLNSLIQANDLGLSPDPCTVLIPCRWQESPTLRRRS